MYGSEQMSIFFPGKTSMSLTTNTKESTMKFAKSLSALMLAASFVALGGCASTSTREGTGEYIDDSVLTAKVKASLFSNVKGVKSVKNDMRIK